MNRQTRRRTLLGGLAVTAVGGTSYLLRGSPESVHGLQPADSLADSDAFAHVGGVGAGERLRVEVAMREREQTGQAVVLFADSDDPVRATVPPLRSFWRFDAPVGDRSPGRDSLRVGDASVPVRRLPDPPTGGDAAVRLTPRITWQSDYLAHARVYGDRNGGRVVVSFRVPTADGLTPDTLELRGPDGQTIGRHTIAEDVLQTAFDVASLVPREADATLAGLRDGEVVDSFPMFYH